MEGLAVKAYLAECVGTFVLVLGGVGSAVLAGSHIGFLGVSLAFGLSLLAMVYTIGPISGCHVNPAVTLGAWAAQVIGAIIAAAVLYLIATGQPHFDAIASGFGSDGYGARSPDHYSVWAALLSEIVMTAFLVLTVLGSTDVKAPVGFAGLAIGLVLALIHLVSIPVDNTSVNPARSIGPALFAGGGAIAQLWLFIIAPLIGAVLAAAVYGLIGGEKPAIETVVAETALPSEQIQRL
jgi:aquaporin Z